MNGQSQRYFNRLINAALACGHHRVLLSLYKGCDSPEIDLAAGAAVSSLKALARTCRAEGRDARSSALYASFGAMAAHYDESYEQWRLVECKDLTPQVIYDAVEKGNKLRWAEWTISSSRYQEVTDDYGLPAWDRIVTIHNDAGFAMKIEYADRPRHRARRIFEVVTGKSFQGDDGLGNDSPHIYERGMPDDYEMD